MAKIILKNGLLINEGKKEKLDLLLAYGIIQKIGKNIPDNDCEVIDLEGKWVMPGIIDDQVHFREPGNTHKGNIATESRAALLGGVTSFMEMPNTKPAAITVDLLEEKYDVAAMTAVTNYSFYIGATNDNIEDVLVADPRKICGIKAFMGSSTGDLLVDDLTALNILFERGHMLIATHCEDEETIVNNLAKYKEKYGKQLNAIHHPIIRNHEGCYLSSSLAVSLAKKYNTRLHILHLTTSKELDLFRNDIPLKEKRITSEVCVHHMFFNDEDYKVLGNKIKCNPAIKTEKDQKALMVALLDNRLDIIATDHAPHTSEEKSQDYLNAPSGLPLVQHALLIMLDFYNRGEISLEDIVRKMCHAPADCFDVEKRGYIREGYFADLTIVDPSKSIKIAPDNIAYKCKWSPLEGKVFDNVVSEVFVNGVLKVKNGSIINESPGMRLTFDR